MSPEQSQRIAAQRAPLAQQLQIHLTRKPEDDGSKKAVRLRNDWEHERKQLEELLEQVDKLMPPPEGGVPVDIPAEAVDTWAQRGVAVVAIPKGKRAELRVSINEWQGLKTIDLRLWFIPRSGGNWGPSKKGVSIHAGKLDALIEGLALAKDKLKES